jgi:hypothetical protein
VSFAPSWTNLRSLRATLRSNAAGARFSLIEAMVPRGVTSKTSERFAKGGKNNANF